MQGRRTPSPKPNMEATYQSSPSHSRRLFRVRRAPGGEVCDDHCVLGLPLTLPCWFEFESMCSQTVLCRSSSAQSLNHVRQSSDHFPSGCQGEGKRICGTSTESDCDRTSKMTRLETTGGAVVRHHMETEGTHRHCKFSTASFRRRSKGTSALHCSG
jgi:hypothetical protein